MRVGQHAHADRAGSAGVDDAHEGVGARTLQADLVHEAVLDVLRLRVAAEPEDPDARFLGTGLLDAVNDGPTGLEHDPREGRIGAQTQLLERHRGLRGRRRLRGLGLRRRDGRARGEPRQDAAHERLGHEPDAPLDAHGRVQHDGRVVHEDL